MIYSLVWLPGVLKAAGLKVGFVEKWEERGHGDVGPILGVLCHHTVGNRNGNMPTLAYLRDGDAKHRGPLSQLGLGRDGTYYVIAAGLCYHAGTGSWNGVTNGNSNFIGIEAENTGMPDDFPWPDVQMDAYCRGVAAILRHIGRGVEFCAGHKEYRLPPGKKIDPSFDMHAFRLSVQAVLNGTVTIRPPIPAAEPPSVADGKAGRPTLRRGATGELVKQVQRKVNIVMDGNFGPKTEAAVRLFQRAHDLVPDGIVGPKTWAKLDMVA